MLRPGCTLMCVAAHGWAQLPCTARYQSVDIDFMCAGQVASLFSGAKAAALCAPILHFSALMPRYIFFRTGTACQHHPASFSKEQKTAASSIPALSASPRMQVVLVLCLDPIVFLIVQILELNTASCLATVTPGHHTGCFRPAAVSVPVALRRGT